MKNDTTDQNTPAVLDMPMIGIGQTRIPKLGLGTWQLEGQEARDVVAEALELGYRHVDTAQKYGNEAEVGAAIMASPVDRHDVFLTTKVWHEHLDHDGVLASFDQSLERLGTGYVDLLLIHWPDEETPLRETMLALKELHASGRARHLGVSNFPSDLLEEACELAPVICNQVECHVFLRQDKLRQQAEDLGIVLTAYCPLARGEVGDDPTLQRIGERHGKTPHQVALRWLIQQPWVVAIPKSSSREHLRSNLAILDFELDDGDLQAIEAIGPQQRLIDPDFAPDWD